MVRLPYRDRIQAGEVLAGRLEHYRGRPELAILALPRGGVPVGAVVAEALGAALDVFLVRKLGAPGQEELAFGAVAAGGVRVLNHALIDELGLSAQMIEAITRRELAELDRRESAYHLGTERLEIAGRMVILVDDGLATGSTMLAAVRAAKAAGAAGIITVAVPVASREACSMLAREGASVIAAATPDPFRAVGRWYENFDQTTDEEVKELLEHARADRPHSARRY